MVAERMTEPNNLQRPKGLLENISLGTKPLHEINKELSKFYTGHDIEKCLLFATLTSHKTNKPIHTVIVGESSGGKSGALKTCLEYMPESSFITETKMLSGITKKALNRFKSKEMQNGLISWDNKIIAVTELDGATESADVIRTLMSEGGSGSLSTEQSQGEHFTKEWTVKGKPLLVTTTANDKIERQFANRCFIILIEATEKDIKNTIEFLAEKGVFDEEQQINYRLKHFIEHLKTMPVIIPYSKEIGKVFPKQLPRANRDFQSFLSLIRTVCLIHQDFRKVVTIKDKDWLIANLDDYEIVRLFSPAIFKVTTKGGLTAREKEFVDAIVKRSKGNFKEIKFDRTVEGINIDELVDELGTEFKNTEKFLGQLNDKKLVRVHKIYRESEGRKPNVYEPTSLLLKDNILPPFFELLGFKKKTDLNGKSWIVKEKKFELIENTTGISLFYQPYNFISGKEWEFDGYDL